MVILMRSECKSGGARGKGMSAKILLKAALEFFISIIFLVKMFNFSNNSVRGIHFVPW